MKETKGSLERIYPRRRKGCEQLHKGGAPIYCNATLQNFWEWYASDIFSNVERGIFAEYIVAIAVGDNRIITEARDGWGPYDLLSSDGIKIEVKSSGYIQDWPQKKESIPIFGIERKLDWYIETNTYSDYPVRSSDIYVFCLYNRRETDSPDTLDPLDVTQWDFYILPTSILEDKVPEQKKIGLGSLNKLGAKKVRFEQIHETIRETHSEANATNSF